MVPAVTVTARPDMHVLPSASHTFSEPPRLDSLIKDYVSRAKIYAGKCWRLQSDCSLVLPKTMLCAAARSSTARGPCALSRSLGPRVCLLRVTGGSQRGEDARLQCVTGGRGGTIPRREIAGGEVDRGSVA
jgi:hypothetical protein